MTGSWASDEPLIGGALILDTSVYLDVLQARTPDAVDELPNIATAITRPSALPN